MAETSRAEDIRVIQTIGHVDHGKTTFVDSLLAANNIISTRMAGKIRYMDSRDDEQQRGITMESSAVSLHFKVLEKGEDGGSRPRNYVVNLIDTPGHVDFSSEVSTASRLCDGALVLVDVVEGVCTQTIAVLRQAWLDRLRPILVINKFDRLITELKLSPVEAYHHLSQLIEQVNAVMGSFFAGERMEDDLRWREEREKRLAERKEQTADEAGADATSGPLPDIFQEKDDEDIYFAPDRGNVIFASAIDGWGFRIGKFAQLFAAKLGVKEANLRKVLWGDFFMDPKTKRVISHKHLRGRNLKPLFVQFVLDNIWAVYDSVVLNPNPEKLPKIVAALNLKIAPRDLKSKDGRHLLSVIFSQWLSLSTCTIQAVIDVVPAPSTAQRSRIPKMLYPELHEVSIAPRNSLEINLWQCDASEDACVVAYISKMFAVPTKDLPEKKTKALSAEEMRKRGREAREAKEAVSEAQSEEEGGIPIPDASATDSAFTNNEVSEVREEQVEETLLGFARLYSGTIHINSQVFCVLPKYNNSFPPTHPRNVRYVISAQIRGLYTMMGRELVPVEKVTAGNVFAVSGLEGKVWRSATICALNGKQSDNVLTVSCSDFLLNLGGVNRQSPPIVKVALESVIPADMPKVVRGLRLLSQSDPCVETFQQQTGEHVILTAGFLHLERCLKDLRERFAKVEIQASKPIVPFRETAIRAPELPPPRAGSNVPRGTVFGSISQGVINFTIRALPLPSEIIKFLQENISLIRKMRQEAETRTSKQDGTTSEVQTETPLDTLDGDGIDDLDEADGHGPGETAEDVERKPTVRANEFWGVLDKLFVNAGPEWKGVCKNIWSFGPAQVGPNILVDRRTGAIVNSLWERTKRSMESRTLRDFENGVETGFQIATFQGPLCAEPVVGMAFMVEDLTATDSEGNDEVSRASGSLITAVKDACRSGILDWSPRLMMAMYTCDIQASTDVLGKVYATVARRRGRIVAEEMKEGTSFFSIKAMLPVIESFGFAEDIRKRTSGAASPQLIFSGYELYDQDPFWVPTTEEELEDLGEKADRENVARVYMNAVRERKGMFVEKKIVQFAEKQRTLKR